MAWLPKTPRWRQVMVVAVCGVAAVLCACLEIDQVRQPSVVAPGDTLTVTMDIHSQGTDPNPHAVFVTVLVPNDWQAIDAKYQSQKFGSGDFVPSQYWADSCEVVHPSGPNYKWVGFLTPRAFLANEERIEATVICRLKVGQQTGSYQLAYTLGEDALGYDTSWGDVYDAVFGVPVSVVTHLAVPDDYPTIQAAINAAEHGMVILVRAGVYVEHVRMKAGVTLRGEGQGKTVILAADPSPTVSGAVGVSLEDLSLVNSADGGIALLARGANGMRLSGCEVVVAAQGTGVACDSASGLTMQALSFRATGPGAFALHVQHGECRLSDSRIQNMLVGVALAHSEGRVAHNLFVGCDSAAIQLNACPAVVVINNTVDTCGYGLRAVASTAEVFNNIIVRSAVCGIWADGGLSCHHNDLWHNVTDYHGCTPGPGALAEDPKFVGGIPFDYHLAPASPCIDAGDPLGPRDPDGTVADLGAFPFQQPGIPSKINYVYLIHFTHLDIGFTDPQDEVAETYKGIIDRAIDYAEAIPEYKWTIESVWQLEQWLARSSPSDVARLERLAEAGKLHLCAGYANMHTAVMSCEEINRFLYPTEQYRQRFGFSARTMLQNDVPGFSWWMPTVLANAGVRYFAAGVNASFGGSAQIPRHHNPFYWEGPDGQRVLTWISRGSYMEWLSTYHMGNLTTFYQALQGELEAYQAAGYPYDAILIMIGSLENTYPSTLITSMAQAWNQRCANPKLVVASPEEFFAHLEGKYGQQFAVYRGDWAGGWDLVSLNVPQSMGMTRRAHDLAIAAEKIATINDLLGIAPYARGAFDAVYTNMLQFDEHSGGGAPWPGLMTPEESQRQSEIAVGYAREALTTATSQLQEGASLLSHQVVTPAPGVVVFNPLSWERSDAVRVRLDAHWRNGLLLVEDAVSGRRVPHQWLDEELLFVAERVPPLGYRLFLLRESAAAQSSAHSEGSSPVTETENEFFRIRVDGSDGRVVSIFDKRHGRELVDSANPFAFNGWLKAAGGGAAEMPLGSARIDTSLRGQVAKVLIIERTGTPFVRSEIWLYAGVPRVEVVNVMDRRLMAWVPNSVGSEQYGYVFPLAMRNFAAYLEGPHGFWNPATDHLPGAPRGAFAIHHGGCVTDGHYRIVWALREPFVVEFERFHGLEPSFDPATATLICRFIKKEDEGRFAGGSVGPIDAEPGTSPLIVSAFAFSADSGGFDPVAVATLIWSFNTPLVGHEVQRNDDGRLSAAAASLLRSSDPRVMVVGLKRAHWGGGAIVRLMELCGQGAQTTLSSEVFHIGSAVITDGVERDVTSAAVDAGGVRLTIAPRQILTLRLEGLTTHALPVEEEKVPRYWGLEPSYPNPFNPETTVSYRVGEEARVVIAVYNSKGQPVRTLVDATVPAGRHQVRWRGDDDCGNSVSSGVYFLRMRASDQMWRRKVVMLK